MVHENNTSTSLGDAKCYTVALAFFFLNKIFLNLIPHTGLQCFLFTRYLSPSPFLPATTSIRDR